MAIFTRRLLQRLLDENSRFLTSAQIREHLNRLNGPDAEQRISTEWEVVTLNAFSGLIHVQFEPPLPGEKKPDVLLEYQGEQVLADITSVSDKGLHKANPIESLRGEFWRLLRKAGLPVNRFSLKVGGNHTELRLGSGKKAGLKLPHPRKFRSGVFGRKFQEFLADVKRHPELHASIGIEDIETQVTFGYNPHQEFFLMNSLAYTTTYSLHNNPLFNRLKRKAEQLRNVSYKGARGIVVCDGGCALLTDRGQRGMWYGTAEVLGEFFRQFAEIGFVQIITVRSENSFGSRTNRWRVVSELSTNGNVDGAKRVLEQLARVAEKMPEPEALPGNSYHELFRGAGRSFDGCWEITGGSVKISVRALQELLAGRITSEEFRQRHENFRPGNGPNMFEAALRDGRLINQAQVTSSAPKDDDWIEFKFGEQDPAIAPFRGPEEKK